MAEQSLQDEDEFETTVTLSLDNGSEVECALIAIFASGERDYAALLPLEGKEADEGEVFIYRYSEDENGEPVLDNIQSDEEYDLVADAFDELLDEEEFNALMDDSE